MVQNKSYAARVAIAILILSMMQNHVNIVSPAMAYITAAFPGAPFVLTAMVITAASIGAIPSALLAGILVRRFGEKKIILFGFILLTVTGILSFAVSNLSLLIFLRLLTGVGVGLISPFQTSLIPEYFEGYAASKLFGLQGFVVSLFGMVFGLLGGLLAAISWNDCFFLYLLGIPAILIVIFWLPKGNAVTQRERPKEPFKISMNFVLLSLFMLVFQCILFTFSLDISYHLEALGLGGSTQAGWCVAIYNVGGVIFGIAYGRIVKQIRQWVLPLGLLIATLGYILLSLGGSMPIILIGSVLSGMSIALVMPTCLKYAMELYHGANGTLATSVLLCLFSLAQFINPVVTNMLRSLLNQSGYRLIFAIYAVALLCLLAAVVIVKRKGLFSRRAPC